MLIFLTYLNEEGTKGSLTFLANPKYTEFIYSTNASAALLQKTLNLLNKLTTPIKVKDPYSSFTTILEHLIKKFPKKGLVNLQLLINLLNF